MKYQVHQLSNKCRVCGGSELFNFLQLDNMPFTDDFIEENKKGTEFLYPINIYYCKDCNTVQTQHDVAVDEYYEDYQYSVGESAFATEFMNGIAKEVLSKYFANASNIKVLEIGSGDGGQLVPFKNSGCKVLGYEPSSFLVEVAAQKGVPSVQGLFNEAAIPNLPDDFKDVDIILLSYTFDHIPDPIDFLNAVHKILNKERGILIIENHDLQKIFERKEYCLFEHEHSIYLTKQTAISLAKQNGMEVIDFDVLPENKRRANSLVFVMTKQGSDFSNQAINKFDLPQYKDTNFYTEQASLIYKGINNFETYINNAVLQGKKLAGYGAGGRGVMTLAALNNANKLEYLVDKKPKKENVFSPKSHLPVYKINHLATERVDEVIVFSFGYMEEIKADLIKLGYRENQIISMLKILND